MKTIYALMAAVLISTGVGCSALNSCSSCGDEGCHVTQSKFAPRASLQEGRCNDSEGLLSKMRWISLGGKASCGDTCGCEASCGCGDEGCFSGGCETGSCGCGCDSGCDSGCGECNQGCLQRGISKLIDCPCGGAGAAGGCRLCGGGADRNYNFNPGPPVGQVAYPYYTTRGPRDFLMANPPSIGPR